MDTVLQDRPEIKPADPDTEKHGLPVQPPPPEIIPDPAPEPEPTPPDKPANDE